MGIRVRKLARELRRSPSEVLGLLQDLGYERYRTPEDMVSDVVAGKIRKASGRSGPGARPLPDAATPRKPAPTAPGDIMAELVPGVKRSQSHAPPTPPPRATPSIGPESRATHSRYNSLGPSASPGAPQAPRTNGTVSQVASSSTLDPLDRERRALEAAKLELAAERAQLEQERVKLREAEAALVARAEALDATAVPEAIDEAPLTVEDGDAGAGLSMLDMFDGRGLKGIDEAERALAALAGAKVLGKLLEHVKVREPDVLRRLLWERLVLVGGPDVPEELDVPSVVVSQDRADIPGANELSRRCTYLGERLMLRGWVRVALVGVARRWHSLLRSRIDRRISISFRPSPLLASMIVPSRDTRRRSMSGSTDGSGSAQDDPIDAFLVWQSEPASEELRDALAGSRTQLVVVAAPDLASWLEQAAAEIDAEG